MYDDDTVKLPVLIEDTGITLFALSDEPKLPPTEPLIDLNNWTGWYGEQLTKLG